jgi:hypothetical protein
MSCTNAGSSFFTDAKRSSQDESICFSNDYEVVDMVVNERSDRLRCFRIVKKRVSTGSLL